jgi:hypothetical protein
MVDRILSFYFLVEIVVCGDHGVTDQKGGTRCTPGDPAKVHVARTAAQVMSLLKAMGSYLHWNKLLHLAHPLTRLPHKGIILYPARSLSG